jgi:hypothetical protein
MLSLAVTLTDTTPETVLPAAGAAIDTEGAALSFLLAGFAAYAGEKPSSTPAARTIPSVRAKDPE